MHKKFEVTVFSYQYFVHLFPQARVCRKCGSIISPVLDRVTCEEMAGSDHRRRWLCRVCRVPNSVVLIAVPYVFKYLCAELAAMNIKLQLDVRQ